MANKEFSQTAKRLDETSRETKEANVPRPVRDKPVEERET